MTDRERESEVGGRNDGMVGWIGWIPWRERMEKERQGSEVGSRKAEVGGRKAEVGGRKSEVGSGNAEVGMAGSRKWDCGFQIEKETARSTDSIT